MKVNFIYLILGIIASVLVSKYFFEQDQIKANNSSNLIMEEINNVGVEVMETLNNMPNKEEFEELELTVEQLRLQYSENKNQAIDNKISKLENELKIYESNQSHGSNGEIETDFVTPSILRIESNEIPKVTVRTQTDKEVIGKGSIVPIVVKAPTILEETQPILLTPSVQRIKTEKVPEVTLAAPVIKDEIQPMLLNSSVQRIKIENIPEVTVIEVPKVRIVEIPKVTVTEIPKVTVVDPRD
jgi:hypothetical protein